MFNRMMHMLTDLIDRKGKIRFGDSEVLRCSRYASVESRIGQ